MSAAVVSRQQSGSAGGTSNPSSRIGTHSPVVDSKRPNPKSEDKRGPSSDQPNNNGRDTAKNSSSKGVTSHTLSPLSNSSLPVPSSIHPPPQVAVDQPPDAPKSTPQSNHGAGPSRQLPNKKLSGDTPGGDYFAIGHTRLDQEPNPFEQSFASNSDPLNTPKTILPPVTAITSPASLLPGGSGGSAFNWGINSLRSGPLSPAMLQGPASNSNVGSTNPLAFDSHIRTGLTPNESGIRSGLTPGGTGALFTQSPSNALFQQFVGGGGATPGTMEFQRTALSAARKSSHPAPSLMPPQQHIKTEDRAPNTDRAQQKRQHLDGYHAADPAHNAANGLFLLANAQHQQQGDVAGASMGVGPASSYPGSSQVPSGISGGPGVTTIDNSSPNLAKRALVKNASNTAMGVGVNRPVSGSIPNSARGISEISDDFGGSSDEEMLDPGSRRNTRPKNPKGKQSTSTARRKAGDSPGGGGRSKKAKGAQGQSMSVSEGSDDEQGDGKDENGKETKKMTDEEKRKNFLERNRVAALKCRQRKKQWLASLQAKVELFSSENDTLTAQVTSLREEIVSLKTLLLAHKDCPVARANGGNMNGIDMSASMPNEYSHVPMMANHYGNIPGMGGGVMAPPGAGRRYS